METSFAKFKKVRPKPVSLPQGDVIRVVKTDTSLPLVIEPSVERFDAASWAAASGEWVEGNLCRHGALLFRGLGLETVTEFELFATTLCPTLFGDYGDLPTEDGGKKVYKSTPYPSDKTILFHNESSHMKQWPMRQFFFCAIPSDTGGETPLVDCRKIYERIEPELRDRFESQGLVYVRNFTEGLDVSWQDFFKTDDRREIEERCRDEGVEMEWIGEGLRTRFKAEAVARHPRTAEKVFFNQLQLHHSSCLETEVRRSLVAMFGEEGLPRNVYYGDGSPIEDEVVAGLLDLYWDEAVSLPWQAGDVVMVDNMLVAHARNPFEGERKIVVAMGEMFERDHAS